MLPFLGMILWYVIADPFMVVRRYSDYFPQQSFRSCANDAFRGIRLMDLYKDSVSYDSFILGSSRSDFYYVDDWKRYIGDSASCFHFNQSGDNLLGAFQRLKYLYERFDAIDNVLLIMDHEFLSMVTPKEGPLFVAPYQVTDEKDFLSFHWSFFRTFYSVDYQKRYWSEGETDPSGGGYYIAELNELHKPEADMSIEKNPSLYYSSIPDMYKLYKRDSVQTVGAPVIRDEQKRLLRSMANMMVDHNTDFRVIYSPLFDQVKLNPSDSLFLSRVFSPRCFFDFSGMNEYTADTLNYYENSHYRPLLCTKILKVVYNQIDNVY